MFKAILLQSWHSLSDSKLEEALRVCIDFMLFTGLGIEHATPDETTICRFRNKLVKLGLDSELFEEINRQIELQGLKVEKATGAIIDASVIESAAKPNRCIEVAIDRSEEDNEDPKTNPENVDELKIHESKDPDAKWLKKGKKCYFGYKLFLSTDDKDGYATGIDATSANKSETKHLAEFVKKIPCRKGMRLYGDTH
jgi:IS5 family transposase